MIKTKKDKNSLVKLIDSCLNNVPANIQSKILYTELLQKIYAKNIISDILQKSSIN